jgi:hypothetical protein
VYFRLSARVELDVADPAVMGQVGGGQQLTGTGKKTYRLTCCNMVFVGAPRLAAKAEISGPPQLLTQMHAAAAATDAQEEGGMMKGSIFLHG